jgi:hypothetical protein
MAAFVGTRVKDALWPELLGIAAYAGGELVLANVDAAISTQVNGYPLAQTLGTAAAIGGSIVAIGKNMAPDFCKGVLYASIVGMVVNLVRSLWEMTKNESTQTAITDIAALIPRRVAPALTQAQKAALQSARNKVALAAAGAKVAGVGVPAAIVPLQYE